MFELRGSKKKRYFNNILEKFFPQEIDVYVEPFGGTFNIGNFLKDRPDTKVYNDINNYQIDIDADYIHFIDYKDIFEMYDSPNTLFYLDPPYYGREDLYELKKDDTDFHIELCEKIKKLKGKVIISYETHPFIKSLYKDFNIYTNEDQDHPSLKRELVITNFNILDN